MKGRRTCRFALLAAAAVAVACPAAGQVFNQTQMTNDFLRMQNLVVTQGVQRDAMRPPQHRPPVRQGPGRSARSNGRPQAAAPSAKPPSRPIGQSARLNAGTTFRPVEATIVPEEFAASAGATAQDRARYEAFFVDLLQAYHMRLAHQGSPRNDIARAAAFSVSEAYSVYHDGDGALSRLQFEGLVNQLRAAFLSAPWFSQLTDRERQRLYERYAIKGAFLGMGHMLTSQNGDRRTRAELRRLAGEQIANTLGARISDIRFTADGVDYR